MRALGPGSVSSFLKIMLDVAYVLLWIAVGAMSLITLVALLLSFNPELLAARIQITESIDKIAHNGPLMVGALAIWTLKLAGWTFIVERLRRIFATLTAGDPFHPDNVRRLRVVGLILAGLEIGNYVMSGLAHWLAPTEPGRDSTLSLNAWFSVLVVFVLAEVFREGARLRREAELTI